MIEADKPGTSLQPRRFSATPDRLVVGLILVQGLLWTATRFNWLGLGQIQGWSVLACLAAVFLVVFVTLLCFAASARFRSYFRYGTRSLLLLIVAAAIACGWFSAEMQRAQRESAAAKLVLDAGGSVSYSAGKSPKALRRGLGDEFFSDVESASASASSDDLFGSGASSAARKAGDPHSSFDKNTLLQMTKGLTNVKSLDLSKTPIDDAALVHLKTFEKLENLHLRETQVTDAGLVHLKELKGLRKLWLDNTRIDGNGLEQLKDLPNLESINLSGTSIGNSVFEQLDGFENLTSLNLDKTEITDAGLQHLSQHPKLRILSLQRTKITDTGLQHLAGLTEMEWLNLRQTSVGKAGLSSLQGMTKLQFLFLDTTQVADTGIEHIKRHTNLRVLTLDGTQVTDLGVKQLEGMTSLETLVLPPDRITKSAIKHLREALPNCRINE
jgi:hypothetical protein